jgi:hypothetical protein
LGDEDEEELRGALAGGNLLAAAPLAELADSADAKLALLQSGIPARTAFIGLMKFYCYDMEPDLNLVYRYARDAILASPADSLLAKEAYNHMLSSGCFSTSLERQIEIANLILAPGDSGFNSHDSYDIRGFLAKPKPMPPEVLLLRGRIKKHWDGRRKLQEALAAAPPALQGEAHYRLAENKPGGDHLRQAAAHGFPAAQSEYALELLARTSSDADDNAEIAQLIGAAAKAGDPTGRLLRSFLYAEDGLGGIAPDHVRAKAIWRTVDLVDVEAVLAKRLPRLRRAQTAFLREKMRDPHDSEEGIRALFLFADLWKEDRDNERFLLLLLKQVYLNPRFNAPAHLPGSLDIVLDELRSNGNSDLVKSVIARYEAGSPGNAPRNVIMAVERCKDTSRPMLW